MRTLAAALVLAGCRLHFDERAAGDAGDAPVLADASDAAPVDAAPLALACNTPVALSSSTSANPHLNAAVLGNSFIVFWLDDLGHVATQFGTLVAPDAVQVNPATVNTQGACSMGSVAVTGSTLLIACGSMDMTASGGTILQPYDTTTGNPIAGTTPSPIRIVSTHGLAAINGAFVLGGVGFNPAIESEVVRLSLTGASTSSNLQVVAGNTNERVAAFAGSNAISVAFGAAIACTARLFVSGALGPAATWGNTGMCQEPIAIPSTSGTQILLVRKDTSDGDLNHQVATVSGNTLSLPGEGKLSGVADEPRGIALGAGYWVSYHTAANTVEAIAVDAAGGKGTAHALGPMDSLDAHDVLAIGSEPYAVWFAGGLHIAHLCP